ncbi:MAG: MbnP family protein [Lishizhenia sp.]
MRKLILFTICAFIFNSCKDKEENETSVTVPVKKVQIDLQPQFGGEDLVLNQTYSTQQGFSVQFSKLAFIATNINNNGEELLASAVYNYEEDGTSWINTEANYAQFSKLDFFLGVPSDRNHQDPSALPNTDPLNILNVGAMHWGWNPGYIFLQIEGKADTTVAQNGTFDQNFVYHVGKDLNLRLSTVENIDFQNTVENTYQALFKIKMEELFDNGAYSIDVRTENSTHSLDSQAQLSSKVISNFANAIVQ